MTAIAEGLAALYRSLTSLAEKNAAVDRQRLVDNARLAVQPLIDEALAALDTPTALQRYSVAEHFCCMATKGNKFLERMWDGSPLNGRSLLIRSDQGLGDLIQLYRFLPPGNVILECPDPLARLFGMQSNAPALTPEGQPLPPSHLHCSITSLPWLTGARQLSAAPYLWVPHRPMGGGVGIVWAGNPDNPDDRNRSMRLRTMLDMLPPGMPVISLKVAMPDEDRATLWGAPHVVDLGSTFADFVDTALVVNQLDLVITVDTSVAHLAGALGKPVWILLPHDPDVRWCEDTPWYPTARLFRQSAAGDWECVGGRVREALALR